MGRIVAALLLLLALSACGESPEDKAAWSESEKRTASFKLERDQAKAKREAEEKYFADCKAKNGDRHWGPFTGYADYRNPRVWYKNGRYQTVKLRIPNVTEEVWETARKQNVCVVGDSDSYQVTIALDTGGSFPIIKRVRESGVRKKDQKRVSEMVDKVSIDTQ